MSDIPEAIGTASEGGLFARAISRDTGDGEVDASGHFAEDECLNCGTELVGSHCHACGQKAHLHRTLSAVGHDLMHGVLHLDGKLWHTLPLLTLHPGKLTRRYIDGKRGYFVSPMALFLFTVFLMFAIFQAIGFTTPSDPGLTTSAELTAKMDGRREVLVSQRTETIEDLEEASGDEAARLRNKLIEVENEIDTLDEGRAVIVGDDTGKNSAQVTIGGNTNPAFIEHMVEKWRKNPGLMLYKLQNNSYKFSWLLIPLSLPFVWLLFAWRREFKAYDHAIFVTYSLAFMSLLFIVLSLLGKIGVPGGLLFLVGIFVPPVHIYRQLRGTYALSRFGAAWRTVVLSIFIVIITALFLQVLLLLGAF